MKRASEKTRTLTLCAIMSAFGFLILLVGSFIDVLDLTAAALASLLCIVTVIEAGATFSYLTYFSTALLAFLLLPSKLVAVIYVLIGYYPIIKRTFDRFPRVLSWVAKLSLFNVALTALWLVCASFFPSVKLSLIPSLGALENAIIGYAAANLVFVLYDIAILKMMHYYFFVLRKRFKK